MRRSTKSFVVLACLAAGSTAAVQAQGVTPGDLAVLGGIARTLHDSGAAWGERIWPGYRPDTIPLVFVVPGRGTVLLGWSGSLPDGFAPLAGTPGGGVHEGADAGAANTGAELAGRRVAQIVLRGDSLGLLGVAFHEAFHVFEWSRARDGRVFGQGEASWLTARYPVFDAANEAGMALEGRIVHAALTAHSTAEARRLGRQYVAARERRLRALEPDFATFEIFADLNEGLAEYALIRAQVLAGAPLLTRSSVRRLDHLTDAPGQSVRLRFYSTGSGIALLLDRIARPGWKQRMMDDNLTLFETLARESGWRDAEDAAVRRASSAFGLATLRARADSAVRALRAERRRQADSLLARDGVRLELDGSALPGRFIGQCGFDPQNLLQVGDGSLLHTRWLRVCSGDAYQGEFNTPVLQDSTNTTLHAVIGPPDSVRVTIGGEARALDGLGMVTGAADVRITSPGLTLHVARADLTVNGRDLRLKLYR